VLTINLQFSDVAWLLGTYQVWLHELYPRAKFADGLIMIEKLGHTKRMQILRSGWIDESKPKNAEENDPDHENQSLTAHPGLVTDPSPRKSNLTPDANSSPPDQEVTMDAGANGHKNSDNFEDTGAPDDDELDQLLAEEPHLNRNSSTSASFLKAGAGHVEEVDYADEEDFMRDLEFPT
jgi:replication fork protection complex subunit Csm3/Swi3